jgi:uncharacterized membrane protein (UPF0127 family)
MVGVLLISCSVTSPPSSQANDAPKGTQTPSAIEGQQLPIGAKVMIGEEEIELEVTQTSEQQQLGLMYRNSLPKNRGMLFSFTPAKKVRFWMKNVVIPLDLIFLQEGTIKAIEANVPPCSLDPCPVYGPDTPIDQVIELRGGRVAELSLKVGDRLKIEFF